MKRVRLLTVVLVAAWLTPASLAAQLSESSGGSWYEYLSEPALSSARESVQEIETVDVELETARQELFAAANELVERRLEGELLRMRTAWIRRASLEPDAEPDSEPDQRRESDNGSNAVEQRGEEPMPHGEEKTPLGEQAAWREAVRAFLSDSSVRARFDTLSTQRSNAAGRLAALIEANPPEPGTPSFQKSVRYFERLRRAPAHRAIVESGIYDRIETLLSQAGSVEALHDFRTTLAVEPPEAQGRSDSLVVARFQAKQTLQLWWLELLLSEPAAAVRRMQKQADALSSLEERVAGDARAIAREAGRIAEVRRQLKRALEEQLFSLSLSWFENAATKTAAERERLRGFFRSVISAERLDDTIAALPALFVPLRFWYETLAVAPADSIRALSVGLAMARAELDAVRAAAYAATSGLAQRAEAIAMGDRVEKRVKAAMDSDSGRRAKEALRDLAEEGKRAVDRIGSGDSRDAARWAALAVVSNRYAQYLLAEGNVSEDERSEFDRYFGNLYRDVNDRFRRAWSDDGVPVLQELRPALIASTDTLPYDKTLQNDKSLQSSAGAQSAGGKSDGEDGNAVAETYYEAFYEVTQPESDGDRNAVEIERWALTHGVLVVDGPEALPELVRPWFDVARRAEDFARAERYAGRGLAKLAQWARVPTERNAARLGLSWCALCSARLKATVEELRELETFEQSSYETEIALAAIWLSEGSERPARRLSDILAAVSTELDGPFAESAARAEAVRVNLALAAALADLEGSNDVKQAVAAAQERLNRLARRGLLEQELYRAIAALVREAEASGSSDTAAGAPLP